MNYLFVAFNSFFHGVDSYYHFVVFLHIRDNDPLSCITDSFPRQPAISKLVRLVTSTYKSPLDVAA